jgi:hypothetical protein
MHSYTVHELVVHKFRASGRSMYGGPNISGP